jgi:hypothetical protein
MGVFPVRGSIGSGGGKSTRSRGFSGFRGLAGASELVVGAFLVGYGSRIMTILFFRGRLFGKMATVPIPRSLTTSLACLFFDVTYF